MSNILTREDVVRLAACVDGAQLRATVVPKLTDEFPTMTIDDAYAVQDELRRLWLARGNRIIGFKAGLTSRAKMVQMGVHVPTFGFLASGMVCPENSDIPTTDMIHPRVEAEVAFVTKSVLRGPGCTLEQVLAATDFVLPAVEILDSRFERFKFDLPSVVADNNSSARLVGGGRPRYADELDLRTLGVVLEKNGQAVTLGASAAVMGHPAEAIAMLVNHLAARGEELPAGSFVMSGGITEAIPVQAGDHITARFQELGSVSMRFV
jgi:2-oxo-3-hexenedioate decarboxylase